jgi:hypothetical protein
LLAAAHLLVLEVNLVLAHCTHEHLSTRREA